MTSNSDPSGLFVSELASLFPFYIGCDADLKVRQVGPQTSVIGGLAPGVHFDDCLKIVRPSFTRGSAAIRRRRDVAFLLEDRTGLRLRGQVLCGETEGPFLFLISPWFTELADAQRYGINLTALPAHDSAREFMYALHLQKQAVAAATRAHEELEQQNSVLTSQFDATQDGVLIENPAHAVVTCNRRFWEVWGLDPSVEKSGAFDLWSVAAQRAADPEVFLNDANFFYNDPDAYGTRLVPLSDGRTLECRTTPIVRHSGLRYGRSWHFRDITIQLRSEQELVRARQLAEQSAHSKSEFLARMSHELRSPLHAVVSTVDLLHNTPLTPIQGEIVAVLRTSSSHLRSVIDDILDFSKVEAGKMLLAPDVFTPAKCVADAVQLFAAPSAQKSLTLSVEVQPGVPEYVYTDEVRIRQILLNFLSNAVKFTSVGRIQVSLGASPAPEGWKLHFTVADTGPGIPPEQLKSLFQPFMQADCTRTRVHQGTGLGLAICKQMAELMGGAAWAESTVGRGSMFHCTILAAAAERPAQGASTLSARRDLGLRVLVVDDVDANLFVARLQLEALGCHVEVADGGLAALSICAGRSFDLVLMDIQMPGIDGFETTRLIRAISGHTATRVVALTASLDDEVRQASIDAGMSGLLGKPWRPVELLAVLECSVPLPAAAPPELRAMPEVDWEVLRGLSIDGQIAEPEIVEILQSFCEFSSGILASLTADAAAADHRALAWKAHSLKGSSGTVGAARLAALAALLETAAIQEDQSMVVHLADQLAACTQTTIALVQQRLARRDGASPFWQLHPESGTHSSEAAPQANSSSLHSIPRRPVGVTHLF